MDQQLLEIIDKTIQSYYQQKHQDALVEIHQKLGISNGKILPSKEFERRETTHSTPSNITLRGLRKATWEVCCSFPDTFTNQDIRQKIPHLPSLRVSHLLYGLWKDGFIIRVGSTCRPAGYKYRVNNKLGEYRESGLTLPILEANEDEIPIFKHSGKIHQLELIKRTCERFIYPFCSQDIKSIFKKSKRQVVREITLTTISISLSALAKRKYLREVNYNGPKPHLRTKYYQYNK